MAGSNHPELMTNCYVVLNRPELMENCALTVVPSGVTLKPCTLAGLVVGFLCAMASGKCMLSYL